MTDFSTLFASISKDLHEQLQQLQNSSLKSKKRVEFDHRLAYATAVKAATIGTNLKVEIQSKRNRPYTSEELKELSAVLPRRVIVLDATVPLKLEILLKEAGLHRLIGRFAIQQTRVIERQLVDAQKKIGEEGYVLLTFNYQSSVIHRLPLLIRKLNAKRNSTEIDKFRLKRYSDWARLSAAFHPYKQLLPPLPITNTTLYSVSRKGKPELYLSMLSHPTLRTLQALDQQLPPVQVRLVSGDKQSDWVEVKHVATESLDGLSGLYFDSSAKGLTDFVRSQGAQHLYKEVSTNIVDDRRTRRRHRTHVLAPVEALDYRRLALQLSNADLDRLLKSVSYQSLPLVELKSLVYHYYCDIDLPWAKYKAFPSIQDFKKSQRAFFAGDKSDFATLIQSVKALFPSYSPAKTLLAQRIKQDADKGGYHVIFKDLLLRNDGVQGRMVCALLEKSFARALLDTSKNSFHKLLAQFVLDDRRFAGNPRHPMQFYVQPTLLHALGYQLDEAQLRIELVRGISWYAVSQPNQKSDRDSQILTQWGLQLTDSQFVKEQIENFLRVLDPQTRYRLVLRLVRRIRWEVLRHLYFFDHAVYQTSMGLRMLGNQKPGEPASQYVSNKKTATVEEIKAYSIRSGVKPLTQPHPGLKDFWNAVVRKRAVRIISLDGLLGQTKLDSKGLYIASMIMEFRTSPTSNEAVHLFPYDRAGHLESKIQDYQLVWPPVINDDKNPLLVRYRNRLRLIYPPSATQRQAQGGSRRFFNVPPPSVGVLEFRVRVFIPAPIVDGPPGTFGGDGRGSDPENGTSRIEIQVFVDSVTGDIIGHQGGFGESTEYNSEDTVQVPGKPGWWHEPRPGATPIDRATASTNWGENLNARAGKDTNGNPTITLSYSGSLPLSSIAPSIDGQFVITLDNAAGSLDIQASHDGFPQHTLYCNGNELYNYDPVAVGNGPMSLFPPNDINQQVRRPKPAPISDPRNPPRGGDSPSGSDVLPNPEDDGMSYGQEDGVSWEIGRAHV